MKTSYLKFLLYVATLPALCHQARATSTTVAHYEMGELEVTGGATVGSTASTLLSTTGSTNMTVTGAPTIGSVGALAGSNYYMHFDGVLQHYEVTPNVLGTSTTTEWMMEAWVRPTTGGSGLGIITSNGHGGIGVVLNYDATNNKYGWFIGGVGQTNSSVGASGLDTTWDHLALVRTSTALTLYVNGVSKLTGAYTGGYANGSAIGSQYSGGANHGFTGDIDDVYFSTITPGTFTTADLHMSAVPEPSTYGLAGAGALAAAAYVRRRRKAGR